MAGDLSGSGDVSSAKSTLLPPVVRREIAAVTLWTLLSDLLIFRTFGFSGPGLFFALVPVLFFMGCPGLQHGPGRKLTIGLMMVVAARLVWLGSGWTIFSAIVLSIALAMSAAGCVPYVLEGCVLAGRAVFDGAKRLGGYPVPRRLSQYTLSDSSVLAWVLPVAAAIVFGSIFVFANPDLFDWFSHQMSGVVERFQRWIARFSIWEMPFCVVAMLVGIGLMRPVLPMMRIGSAGPAVAPPTNGVHSQLYSGYRNTLLTLIVLFAVYLMFEFVTLWTRDFPEGFYYAGYAHQGAAWLTFALALATAVLSIIFSGSMLRDDRLGSLRQLAWIWSAQNMLLAAAVYNRMMIYVGYNGMTRLRTVGFFGITVVVVGFCLVIYKIRWNQRFWWLIRAQLIALVLTVIAYSVFPVDYVAHRYNAAAVASGYLHPSVMIAVKATSDEGILPLMRLTTCPDETIRRGVLAILAKRQLAIEGSHATNWTEFQGARAMLRRRLKKQESQWAEFRNQRLRENAIGAFRNYAMQWY